MTVKSSMISMMAALLLAGTGMAGEDLIVLCYHDIPNAVKNDIYGVSVSRLVDQIEYLRTHGYTFIGPAEIRAARDKKKPLPDKPVLLTFDDGYVSFYDNVVPVLELFQIPAVLAVCTSWLTDGPPENLGPALMTWEQIKILDKHPLVHLASHSHNLHHAVPYNPQGNTAHAAVSRIYFPDKKRYETEAEHRARIDADMAATIRAFQEGIGSRPTIYVWPYGWYNSLTRDAALKAGFDLRFTLDNQTADTLSTEAITRWMIMKNPSPKAFVQELRDLTHDRLTGDTFTRSVQVDLDLIYDASAETMARNLDRVLDRLVAIQPSHVILQGFADPDGDGNADAVYFPNRVLPVRADILNRVANQLIIRGIRVFIWMPMLSIKPPNEEQIRHLYVQDKQGRRTPEGEAGYVRLSPFSDEAREIMATLYGDLAAHVRFNGILFQDDGMLSDFEDFSPAGQQAFQEAFGKDTPSFQTLTPDQQRRWTALKTEALIAFSRHLMTAVRRHKPDADSARTLYALALENPHSKEWFAQNFAASLKAYDQVVIMAYPEMERVFFKERWLKKLVSLAAQYPEGLEKTVFKLQAYDWRTKRWVKDEKLVSRVRILVAAGARHVAYYPDDYTANRPDRDKIRMEMSVQSDLALPPPRPKTVEQR